MAENNRKIEEAQRKLVSTLSSVMAVLFTLTLLLSVE